MRGWRLAILLVGDNRLPNFLALAAAAGDRAPTASCPPRGPECPHRPARRTMRALRASHGSRRPARPQRAALRNTRGASGLGFGTKAVPPVDSAMPASLAGAELAKPRLRSDLGAFPPDVPELLLGKLSVALNCLLPWVCEEAAVVASSGPSASPAPTSSIADSHKMLLSFNELSGMK